MIGGAMSVPLVVKIPQPELSSEGDRHIKKINNYRLVAKLGHGASSKVFLGIDDETGAKYAIKRIRLRDLCRATGGIAQLEREIRLMARALGNDVRRLLRRKIGKLTLKTLPAGEFISVDRETLWRYIKEGKTV